MLKISSKRRRTMAQIKADKEAALAKEAETVAKLAFLEENQEKPLHPEDEDSEDVFKHLWFNKVQKPGVEVAEWERNEKSETTKSNICKRLSKYLEPKFECKKHLTDHIFTELANQAEIIEQSMWNMKERWSKLHSR